jgi:hypothetical protein
MLKRVKDNFESGVEKIKWFSSLLSERMKIELSVMKLLLQSAQMERKKDDLLKTIGRRLLELKEQSDRDIMKDRAIAEAVAEIEKISDEIETIRKKASEISKIEG